MGTKERREREKQQLRDKILDAAREMFARDGYEAFTMRSLAHVIEYSPTAIYLHFKDKESLIAELCAADLAVLDATVKAITEKVDDQIKRLKEAGLAFIKFGIEHPTQYQVVFVMPKPRDPTSTNDLLSQPYETSYASLREGFLSAIDAGLLKREFDDPGLLAQVYFCGLHGIVSTRISAPDCLPKGWSPPLKQAELFIETFMKGLLK